MSEYQRGSLNPIRSQPECERAAVFLHGFSGDRDDTWDRLPGLLGTAVADWDIYTLGYATTFRPDFLGVWSADPDLPILATMMTTQASIDPLRRYGSLAVVAHSMGGLIVQRARAWALAGARGPSGAACRLPEGVGVQLQADGPCTPGGDGKHGSTGGPDGTCGRSRVRAPLHNFHRAP